MAKQKKLHLRKISKDQAVYLSREVETDYEYLVDLLGDMIDYFDQNNEVCYKHMLELRGWFEQRLADRALPTEALSRAPAPPSPPE